MMPRRPGDHVKTDRRDAMTLARLLRAGELTAIWVPDEAHEAVRDLIRKRSAKEDATGAKQTVKSFLLRHDRRYGGKGTWTKMYWRWLSEQRFDFPHQQLAFEEMQKRVLEAQARAGRLEARPSARQWRAGGSPRLSAIYRRCVAFSWSAPQRWSPKSAILPASTIPSS
jgi:transposase